MALALPLLGLLIFGVFNASTLATQVTLVRRSAADLNLQVNDLGAGFKMISDLATDATVQEGVDVNKRVFSDGNDQIVSQVFVSDIPWAADVGDLLKMPETDAGSIKIVWGPGVSASVGEHAAMLSFTRTTSLEQRTGFMMAFVQNNVIVVLTESKLDRLTKPERLLALATIIEGRMK